jgi:hypothetical protein
MAYTNKTKSMYLILRYDSNSISKVSQAIHSDYANQ